MHKRTAAIVSTLCFAVLLACQPQDLQPEGWALDDDRLLSDLTGDAQPVVVLVFSPSDCFTCAATLSEWLDWRRSHPDQFRFVFSRPPTRAEERSLRTVRLPLDGVLKDPPRRRTPMEMVFDGGRPVYVSDALAGRSSPLLTRLRSETLESILDEIAAPRVPSP